MKYGIIKLFGYVGKSLQQMLNIEGDFVAFDLIDVIKQVKDCGEVDVYVFVIDSPGGIINVGKDIYNYMLDLDKPRYTIALKECASIATMPLLAGEVGNRIAITGQTKVMIHNPWTQVEGDANELISVGNEIKIAEEELLDFYADATGTPVAGIAPLMTNESFLSIEESITLGFIDRQMTLQEATALFGDISTPLVTIVNARKKALAFFNLKTKNMSTKTETLKEKMAKFAASIGYKGTLKTAVATSKTPPAAPAAPTAPLTMTTNDGKTISIAKDASDPTPDVAQVGDALTVDGAPAANATLTTDDGTVITTDANSCITAIQTTDEEDGEMEARAVKAEAELAATKKLLEDEKAKVVALNKTVLEKTQELADAEEDMTNIMAVAKLKKSSGTPTTEDTRFAGMTKEAKEAAIALEKGNGTAVASHYREKQKEKRAAIAARIAGK